MCNNKIYRISRILIIAKTFLKAKVKIFTCINKQLLQIILLMAVFLVIFATVFQIAPEPIFSAKKVPFITPLDGRLITRFRESYWDEVEKVERKHTGIDIEGESGDKVIASGNGVVSYIGISPIGGRTIVIKHNEKIRTTYLNFLQILVSLGSAVKQGDVIGTIGADDDPSSKIPHLHFGIIYDGKYLNPEDVLNIDYTSISKFLYLKYLKPDFSVELK